MINLKQLQTEHAVWVTHNFPNRSDYYSLLGVVEEVGELSHSHLKRIQGIRGTEAEHRAKERDAIGDIIIYLTDYCSANGYDIEAIVSETWDEVKQRDWVKYPTDGKP